MVVVRAYGRMLPRLEAEESLHAAERIAIGTRNVGRDTLREVMGRWKRDASQGAIPAAASKLPLDAMPAIGIGYQVVERTPTEAS